MTTYRIEEVVGQRPWGEGSEYGPKIDYTIALEGVPQQVSLNQKPESPAPKAGDTIDLILEDFPEKQVEKVPRLANMKKATRPKAAFGGGGFGGGPRPEDPKRNAGIVRQHSQDMAIQVIRLGLEMSIIPEKPADMKSLLDLVRRTADYLDADVKKVRDAV
jgi:hypothetical protein